jgi:hypothetical protein
MVYRDVSRAIVTNVWLAALVGCSPTEPRDFLDARFVLEEPVVRSGAASSGRVEITNHGSEAVEVEAYACPPRVLLFDRRGYQLGQPDVSCVTMLVAPVRIAPGETFTYVQGWRARMAGDVPLPSGTYRVQVWIALVGGGLPVLTNRAAVEVREEEDPPPP